MAIPCFCQKITKQLKVYDNPLTVITLEYPMEQADGNEAFYPINDEWNNQLYLQYKALADQETDVIFGGRLAEYCYYDMDKVIESALKKWKDIASTERNVV